MHRALNESDFKLESSTFLSRIFYLSVENQEKSEVNFVKRLSWNSFGRKNLGYLYAIASGAEVIFDFDDDNLLKFWVPTASPTPTLDIDFIVDNLATTGKKT